MKKFEYRNIHLDNLREFDTDFQKRLNEFGAKGWEVASSNIFKSSTNTRHMFIILKRELAK